MKHLDILQKLNEIYNANFYFVGGFVRDMLSGIYSDDYDIATDILPDDILKISEQKGITAIPTGIKHGTVTVLLDGKNLEITTFREDFENNGRHAAVKFTKYIKQDSFRRDFTINAIYQDSTGKIYDFHDGQNDLKKGRVKFIGKPEERINEDYLRVLRFFRFFADFDKTGISVREKDLLDAMYNHADKVSLLSADRITQEFIKLSKSENYAKGFACLVSFDNLARLFSFDSRTVNSKDLSVTKNLDPFVKLALLYRNNLTEFLANRHFNFSNNQKKLIKSILKANIHNLTEDNAKILAVKFGVDIVSFVSIANYLSGSLIKLELDEIQDILNSDLPKFEVTGADLIALGFVADKTLGLNLAAIKQYWLDNNFINKEKCLQFARSLQESSL